MIGVGTATTPGESGSQTSRPRLLIRLFRASTSSLLSTALSQAALIGLLWINTSPTLASTAAFVAGAIPNYFLTRSWAWGRRGKPTPRELIPYFVVIGATGIASVGLTTVAGWLTEPLGISGFLRIVVLDAAYLASYSLVFFMKFLLLDRLVFRDGHPARTRVSRSQS